MKNAPASTFLLDMYNACQLITALSQIPFETFQENQIQISAMLWQFNVLGEAVNHLQDQGFTENHPEIPWKEMRAIRNRIVHGYSSVDIPLMRTVSLEDIPKVLSQLENLSELKDLIQENQKIIQEKAAVLLTGVQDPASQEEILRQEIRNLVRAQKLNTIPAKTWKEMTISQMVNLVNSVPEMDRIQAHQKALEAIHRKKSREKTSGIDIDI